MLLTELAPLVNAQNGVIYLVEESNNTICCGFSRPTPTRR